MELVTHILGNCRQFPGSAAPVWACDRFDSFYERYKQEEVKTDGEYVWTETSTGRLGIYTSPENLTRYGRDPQIEVEKVKEVLSQNGIPFVLYREGLLFSTSSWEEEGAVILAMKEREVPAIGYGAFDGVKIFQYDSSSSKEGEYYTKRDRRKLNYGH